MQVSEKIEIDSSHQTIVARRSGASFEYFTTITKQKFSAGMTKLNLVMRKN
jgi:hypothetical protein